MSSNKQSIEYRESIRRHYQTSFIRLVPAIWRHFNGGIFCVCLETLFRIYLFHICFYIPPSRAITSKRSPGSRVWCLDLLLGILAAPQIVRLLSNAKSAAQVPNHRCQLHCIIRSQFVATVRRIANSIEFRDLNLNRAPTHVKLNPGPFAPAAECITIRSFRHPLTVNGITSNCSMIIRELRLYNVHVWRYTEQVS